MGPPPSSRLHVVMKLGGLSRRGAGACSCTPCCEPYGVAAGVLGHFTTTPFGGGTIVVLVLCLTGLVVFGTGPMGQVLGAAMSHPLLPTGWGRISAL